MGAARKVKPLPKVALVDNVRNRPKVESLTFDYLAGRKLRSLVKQRADQLIMAEPGA